MTSDIEATSEVQTIGTLIIIRGNNESDPQRQLVVVKKEKTSSEGDPVYAKVSSVKSGKKYILVSYYGDTPYICSGLISNKGLTMVNASLIISNNEIPATDTTNPYAVTITEKSKGIYSVINSNGDGLKVSKGDISTGTSGIEWTITQRKEDDSFIISNTNTTDRALYIGNKGQSCKNYAISNFGTTGYASTYMTLYEYSE